MILAIYGAGGQGKEVREIVEEENELLRLWSKVIYIDDFQIEGYQQGTERLHFETVVNMGETEDIEYVVALGEPEDKRIIYSKLKKSGCNIGTVISPDAKISKYAQLGKGVIIKRGAIVSPGVRIGANTTIQSYSCIGHDAIIGDNCQISTHVVVGGGTVIGDNVFVGLNVPIREKLKIGNNVVVSAGSVVLKDILSDVTVMGNPARVIEKHNSNKKILK